MAFLAAARLNVGQLRSTNQATLFVNPGFFTGESPSSWRNCLLHDCASSRDPATDSGGEPSNPRAVRNDAPADLGAVGPHRFARDECNEAAGQRKDSRVGWCLRNASELGEASRYMPARIGLAVSRIGRICDKEQFGSLGRSSRV